MRSTLTHAAAAVLILAALVLAMSVAGELTVYNGLNKGVVIGHIGFELVGEPGFFISED